MEQDKKTTTTRKKKHSYDRAYYKKLMSGITLDNYQEELEKRSQLIKTDMEKISKMNGVLIKLHEMVKSAAVSQMKIKKGIPTFPKKVKTTTTTASTGFMSSLLKK